MFWKSSVFRQKTPTEQRKIKNYRCWYCISNGNRFGCGRGTWTPDLRVMRNAPWISYSLTATHIIPESQCFQEFRGICFLLLSHPIPWNPVAVGVSVGVNSENRAMRWPILLAQPRKNCTFRFLPLRNSVHRGSGRTRNRPSGIRIVPTSK